MTSLVSLEDVQVRLKLGDSIPPGVESLLLQLMDFTTLQIAEYLRVVSFDQYTDRVDEFYVDSQRLKPFRMGYPALMMSRGFLTALTSITRGLTYQTITDNVIPAGDYKAKLELGHVQLMGGDFVNYSPQRLLGASYDQEYMAITYSGGFSASAGVYKSVPSWLQSIALAVIADAYLNTSGCTKGDCCKACGAAINKYASMLDSYLRYEPEAYDPL